MSNKTIKGEGTAGHVAGTNSGHAPEQPFAKPEGGDADLANQKVKILAGRYSPKSHLEREGMKKK